MDEKAHWYHLDVTKPLAKIASPYSRFLIYPNNGDPVFKTTWLPHEIALRIQSEVQECFY
jgi:hypothetical protein